MGVLGEIKWYSKLDLAEHQLNRAINLYLDEKDFISSITLAGAAEELLGKILNQVGVKNALDEYVDSFNAFGNELKDYEKWFVSQFNYYKNNLKHLEVKQVKNSPFANDPPPIDIPIYASAVTDVIHRALTNHSRLNRQSEFCIEKLNPNINRFYASEQ